MPELSEVITSKSVAALQDAFTHGVRYLREERDTVAKPYFHQEEMGVAEPLVRHVYKQLMKTAKRDPKAPHPKYPWRVTELVADVLRREGAAGFNINNLSRQVFAMLVGNGIGFKLHTGRSPLYLRIWPDDESLRWMGPSTRTTEDARVEKRIKEERDKPVHVYRNLRKIALPATFDPDSIKEWVDKFVPAALALQDEYNALRAEVEELREQVEASKDNAGAWSVVGDSLEAAFADTRVSVKGVVATPSEANGD